MQARLNLILFGEPVCCGDCDDSDGYLSAEMSYTSRKAQSYLRKVTKRCFEALRRRHKELLQGDLAEMRKNFGKAIQVYDKFVGLEKSRAEIPNGEQVALEIIEQKIEDCLNTVSEVQRDLSKSTYRVKRCLGEMREYLDAYGELLQHLKNHSKEQYYQGLLTKLEKKYDSCHSHPILELNVDQKRSDLLEHLRNKRWREQEEYDRNHPLTREDLIEGIVLGWW